MKPLSWTGDGRLRTATTPGARWFAHVQLWRPADPDQVTTDEVETAVVLLSGTFDLGAGPTAWPARGARQTPFAGRPMAVYLPPRTTLRTQRGSGEILLVAARQPAAAPASLGRDGLSQKPLLPLAGSGKSFDPGSGEWRPAETFPDAPESLPPRRMEQLSAGGTLVERVFAADYKAATLSLDEAVLPRGANLCLADIPARPRASEVLLFVRSEAATIARGADRVQVCGDAVLGLTMPDAEAGLAITSVGGPTYVVLAYAGKPGRP